MTRRGLRGAGVLVLGAVLALATPVAGGAASAPAAAAATSRVPQLDLERLRERLRKVTYTQPVDLGVPGDSVAEQITDSGVVVGSTRIQGRSTAFRWRDGKVTLLDGPDGRVATVVAVNDAGLAVGSYRTDSRDPYAGHPRASLWDPVGRRVPLGPPDVDGAAVDVTSDGTVVLVLHGQEQRTLLWKDGVETEVPGLTAVGGRDSINEAGDLVGVTVVDGVRRAAVLRDGVLDVLPSPDGLATHPLGIDEQGRVWGWTSTAAALWEADGTYRSLDPDGVTFWPREMDDDGRVYGAIYAEAGFRAAVSDHRGVTQLHTLDARDSYAYAVSGSGVAVGFSESRTERGTMHPVAWFGEVPVLLGKTLPPVAGAPATDPALATGRVEDVNDSHVAVGAVSPTSSGWGSRAVLWRLNPKAG